MLPATDSPIGDTPALIVVDAQGDCPQNSDDSPMTSDSGSVAGGRGEIIERINEVVEHARAADVPIIWGNEGHRPDFADYGAEFDSCEPVHALADNEGTSLDERLVVEEGTGSPTQELHERGLRMLRSLQPRGVRDLDEVTDALGSYEGDPVVRRVKETGLVRSETGAVPPLDGEADPLRLLA